MTAASTQHIAGIVIPDTPLVREITEYIRDTEDELLFNHSRRVFLFGALQGHRRGLQPDPELLYAGAMFHDIGLTADYRKSMLRFEVDGANAAWDFLLERGVDEAAARKVWLPMRCIRRPACRNSWNPKSHSSQRVSRLTCWASVVTICPPGQFRRSPLRILDPISRTGSCGRSPMV
jgi:hypothetical protein